MSKILALLFFIPVISSLCFSQPSAPLKWEQYSVPEKNVTVLMPRLPVAVNSSNLCFGEKTIDYAAYTDGAVYLLRTVSRMRSEVLCANKRSFDNESFEIRLKGLRGTLKDFQEEKAEGGGLKGVKFTTKDRITLLLDDYANKRWFELWVEGGDQNKPEVKKFLESLKIEKPTTGKDIGGGSPFMLGDETVSDCVLEFKPPEKPQGDPKKRNSTLIPVIKDTDLTSPRLILKPKPPYTEEARKQQVRGKVELRVTFSSNGAISNIVTVTALSYGLREQAIAAALKIVFIPAVKNNKFCTTTRLVQYNFEIY